MYKKTSASENYLDRTGSFSTHASARGIVKTPPKEAIDEELRTTNSLLSQVDDLKKQVGTLWEKIRIAKLAGDWALVRDLDNQRSLLKSELGNIKRIASLAREGGRAWVFYSIAKRQLSKPTLRKIEEEVDGIFAEAQRLLDSEK